MKPPKKTCEKSRKNGEYGGFRKNSSAWSFFGRGCRNFFGWGLKISSVGVHPVELFSVLCKEVLYSDVIQNFSKFYLEFIKCIAACRSLGTDVR